MRWHENFGLSTIALSGVLDKAQTCYLCLVSFHSDIQFSRWKKQETTSMYCSAGQNGNVIDRIDLATGYELRHSTLAVGLLSISKQVMQKFR